ncbi:hypothetical protein M3629_00725 [Paenibacillus polysaccharolyticus]|uniref:hypothetical protein n=1 Tax=Paenibacillus polysaccharolyticus TaxID=582692 RepID=UPI0020403838|nr:hypothetical protein [Paenibacillus polysaccharolyticus]MCM3131288.1 hypothetical protein [Paenibacillus polysaccharolyticus]
MDILMKVLLSTTLIYFIHFIIKTFTANEFDKLFLLKHQIYLHNTFLFTLVYVVLMAYVALFVVIIEGLKNIKYIDLVMNYILFLYLISLIIVIVLYLYKKVKDKHRDVELKLPAKVADSFLFCVFFLNILVFSNIIHKFLRKDDIIANIINCVILFSLSTYFILKSNLYLQGFNRRKWYYVLSPTPKDIHERYLYVLYSLTATTLVLSDDPSNKKCPRNVYLFDLNKNSYTCFNRVTNLQKQE